MWHGDHNPGSTRVSVVANQYHKGLVYRNPILFAKQQARGRYRDYKNCHQPRKNGALHLLHLLLRSNIIKLHIPPSLRCDYYHIGRNPEGSVDPNFRPMCSLENRELSRMRTWKPCRHLCGAQHLTLANSSILRPIPGWILSPLPCAVLKRN